MPETNGFQRFYAFIQVRHHCPGVPCILVGTQVDLRSDPATLKELTALRQKPITTQSGEKLAREMGAVAYLESSALKQAGIKDVFDEAMVTALEPPSQDKKKCLIM